jgi:uncharacterized peroxidase-related enzyme
MDQKTKPSPRVAPLPADLHADLKESFESTRQRMGFLPNSMLIMQRRPKIVKAFTALGAAIRSPDCEVDPGLMALISHVCSRAAGCRYCMAHTAHSAEHRAGDEKLAAVWEYRTSPLFSEKERVALDFALAAGSVPNDVTDELMAEMKKHWTENQIVDIAALIAYFGFLNRWNDTMATPLEAEPIEIGEKFLAPHGWSVGKHVA